MTASLAVLLVATACSDSPGAPGDPDDDLIEISVEWASVTLGMGGFTDYTCGLARSGSTYCWGANIRDRDLFPTAYPTSVPGGLTLQSIEGGWQHVCGLDNSGRAFCWGAAGIEEHNDATGPKIPTPVPGSLTFSQLTAANFLTCGISEGGTGWCWSASDDAPEEVPGGHSWTALSAGTSFTCGLDTTGAAHCWGENGGWQFGDGTQEDSQVPVPVAGGLTYDAISAGRRGACGITMGGEGYCWGGFPQFAPFDTIFIGGPTPRRLSTEERFSTVSVGNEHACGLTADGRAFCWGANAGGQLGDGSNAFGRNFPVPVSGGLTFETIEAGGNNTCGTTADGAAYCWGYNDGGQLGDGSGPPTFSFDELSRVPVRVVNPRVPAGG